MCRRSVRVLRALDWRDRLRFVDSTGVPDEELPVSRDTAMTGIPLLTPDGRTLVGFPAVRRALRRTPLGVLPALLLTLPGIAHAADAAYRWIAAHRARCEVCAAATERG